MGIHILIGISILFHGLTSLVLASSESLSSFLGVAPEDINLFKPTVENGVEYFKCLKTAQKIPYKSLNDDYCDCEDGSDEPGTSACSLVNSNGVFYCKNEGFDENKLPSSMVNDGICDYSYCCDGSDEYNGLIECPDRCSTIGKERNAIREAKILANKEGISAKKILTEKGLKLIDKQEQELKDIRKKIEDIQSKIDSYQPRLKELRELEDVLPPKTTNNRQSNSGRVRNKIKHNINTEKDIFTNIKTLFYTSFGKVYLYLESVLKNFGLVNEEIEFLYDNKLFNDVNEDVEDSDEGEDETNEDKTKEMGSQDEKDGVEEEESDEVKQARINEEKELAKLREELDGIEDKISSLENDKRANENEFKSREDNLNSNIVNHPALYSLEGECYQKDYNDFSYEICLFDKAYQKEGSNRGSRSGTNLGKFEKLNIESSNNININFTKGSRCWNGPVREMKVILECGTQTELVDVREVSKCFYEGKFITPAVCNESINKIDFTKLKGPQIDKILGIN